MDKVLKYKNIEQDEITEKVSRNFDYDFNGISECAVPTLLELPTDFKIGLIVGPSGSGKSTMLKLFGEEKAPQWHDNKAIVSHFNDADDAQKKLSAVGLNSIPAWFRPYKILSTGEKYRANLARQLSDNAVVDEFTSVVDRSVAKSCSAALSRYIKGSGIHSVVFASCHYDIIEWLQPDWVYDISKFAVKPDEKCYTEAQNHKTILYNARGELPAQVEDRLNQCGLTGHLTDNDPDKTLYYKTTLYLQG